LNTGKKFRKIIKDLDKTRPISGAWSGGSSLTALAGQWGEEVCDMMGINYAYSSLPKYHEAHPSTPLISSESCSCTSDRTYLINDTRALIGAFHGWSCIRDCWAPIANGSFIQGSFDWTGFDYRGEETPSSWPAINSHFGILDLAGYMKDDAYYYKAWYDTETPLAHITPPNWNYAAPVHRANGTLGLMRCTSTASTASAGTTDSTTPNGPPASLEAWSFDFTAATNATGSLIESNHKPGQCIVFEGKGIYPAYTEPCDKTNPNMLFFWQPVNTDVSSADERSADQGTTCSATDFPYDLNGGQVGGLSAVSAAKDLASCRQACCDKGSSCEVYQWSTDPATGPDCWVGKMAPLVKSSGTYTSRSRATPPKPSDAGHLYTISAGQEVHNCVDVNGNHDGSVGFWQCKGPNATKSPPFFDNQAFTFSNSEFRQKSAAGEDMCLAYVDGASVQVWVYTNGDEVELLLNGESLGVQQVPMFEKGTFTTIYKPGNLTAVVKKRGTAWATDTVHTATAAKTLVLEVDPLVEAPLRADGNSATLLTAKVVDANGNVVHLESDAAQPMVTFSVKGQGQLIGLGSGDPSDHTSDKGSSRRAFNGLVRAIVQATTTAGAIEVTATAPGLASATATITSTAACDAGSVV
jgi:hypothetical protein